MASPRRSTKRRSAKRSPKKNSWVRKLMAWRKANKHKDGSLPSMKRAMKACKGKSGKRSKCRKSAGRKSVRRSSKRRSMKRSGKRSTKRRSTKKSSKRRSSKRKSTKKSSKRRSTKKSSKRRSSKRKSTKKSSKRRSTKRRSTKKSSKRRSSKRRSKKKSSKRRSSPTRKLRKYYPSFVGKRFQKFERPMSMPRYAAASANDAPYTGPTLLLGDISSQQKEERLKDEQARESAEQKENLYATLGIEKTDSQEEIKKAYRKMALSNHPDRGGNVETFQKIGKAYRILSNERAKKVYDDAYKPGIFA